MKRIERLLKFSAKRERRTYQWACVKRLENLLSGKEKELIGGRRKEQFEFRMCPLTYHIIDVWEHPSFDDDWTYLEYDNAKFIKNMIAMIIKTK